MDRKEYNATHRIEDDYHGYALRVDDKGKFMAFDDGGAKMGEANSLQALKDLLRKPVKLDIKGMVTGDSHFSFEDNEEHMKAVHVYAVTGLGTLLYSIDGEKKRATQYAHIYAFDPGRASRWEHFKAVREQADANLEKLMKGWPKIDGKKLLAENKP